MKNPGFKFKRDGSVEYCSVYIGEIIKSVQAFTPGWYVFIPAATPVEPFTDRIRQPWLNSVKAELATRARAYNAMQGVKQHAS